MSRTKENVGLVVLVSYVIVWAVGSVWEIGWYATHPSPLVRFAGFLFLLILASIPTYYKWRKVRLMNGTVSEALDTSWLSLQITTRVDGIEISSMPISSRELGNLREAYGSDSVDYWVTKFYVSENKPHLLAEIHEVGRRERAAMETLFQILQENNLLRDCRLAATSAS